MCHYSDANDCSKMTDAVNDGRGKSFLKFSPKRDARTTSVPLEREKVKISSSLFNKLKSRWLDGTKCGKRKEYEAHLVLSAS